MFLLTLSKVTLLGKELPHQATTSVQFTIPPQKSKFQLVMESDEVACENPLR